MNYNSADNIILTLEEIHTFYGSSHVLFGISLKINKEEAVCLLGRNGAGKSTTLLSIMGAVPPLKGKVKFLGIDITGLSTYKIARLGIALVPQERRIFPDLTVKENLIMPFKRPGGKWSLEYIYEIFPILKQLINRWGGSLSGGEQQMLAIGRSLMLNPELLLLDEPGEGLSPLIVRHLAEGLLDLNKRGLTLLIAEQNFNFAAKVCSRAYVIEKGEVRYEGSMNELNLNMEIKKKYLAV